MHMAATNYLCHAFLNGYNLRSASLPKDRVFLPK